MSVRPDEVLRDHARDTAGDQSLLPPGEYTIQSRRVEVRTSRLFGRRIVVLHVEVVGGPDDGTPLCWYAPLPSDRRRPGLATKFRRAWVLTAGRQPNRGEHLSAEMLVGKRYRAVVATVTTSWERDGNRRPVRLPRAAWYSVVSTLLEREA